MNTKDQWIKETEESLNGLKTVEAPAYLYSKILNRMDHSSAKEKPGQLVWLALSSLLVLVLLNIFVLKQTGNGERNKSHDLTSLTEQFDLMDSDPINYN